MGDIYVMQRANGDVFSLANHGRLRVPLFRSSSDALLGRLRNFEMLLFTPVRLDASLLEQIVPEGGAAELDFWLVNDPFINFKRGRLVQPAELGLLVGDRMKLKVVRGGQAMDESLATSPYRNGNATSAWENEGGLHSKCA